MSARDARPSAHPGRRDGTGVERDNLTDTRRSGAGSDAPLRGPTVTDGSKLPGASGTALGGEEHQFNISNVEYLGAAAASASPPTSEKSAPASASDLFDAGVAQHNLLGAVGAPGIFMPSATPSPLDVASAALRDVRNVMRAPGTPQTAPATAPPPQRASAPPPAGSSDPQALLRDLMEYAQRNPDAQIAVSPPYRPFEQPPTPIALSQIGISMK